MGFWNFLILACTSQEYTIFVVTSFLYTNKIKFQAPLPVSHLFQCPESELYLATCMTSHWFSRWLSNERNPAVWNLNPAEHNSYLKLVNLCFYKPVLISYYALNTWKLFPQFGDILRTPVVKFVAQAVSFIFFLGLILTHSYVEQKKLCSTRFTDDPAIKAHWNTHKHKINSTTGYLYLGRMCVRNHTPSFLEVLIMIWITGQFLLDLHIIYMQMIYILFFLHSLSLWGFN